MRIQQKQPEGSQPVRSAETPQDITFIPNQTEHEQELEEAVSHGYKRAIRVVRASQERTGTLYTDRRPMEKPEDILCTFGGLFERAGVERLIAVVLTRRGEPVAAQLIAVGGVDSCMVNVAEILKLVLLSNCSTVLIAHNHPSGSTEPSEEDREITKRVVKAAKIVGIRLVDHIIVGDRENGYSILADREVHLSGKKQKK